MSSSDAALAAMSSSDAACTLHVVARVPHDLPDSVGVRLIFSEESSLLTCSESSISHDVLTLLLNVGDNPMAYCSYVVNDYSI